MWANLSFTRLKEDKVTRLGLLLFEKAGKHQKIEETKIEISYYVIKEVGERWFSSFYNVVLDKEMSVLIGEMDITDGSL